MRWLLPLAVCAPALAAAAPASDPAFLGIGMVDMQTGCRVSTVTAASPARDAGIVYGDTVVAIDGARLVGPRPCDMLAARIADHHPGDRATLDLLRGIEKVTVRATLTSRGEMLSRRLLGETVGPTDISDADDDHVSYDLGARGQTRIVGWFTLQSCNGCGRTFDAIVDRLGKRMRDAGARVLAVTSPVGDLAAFRKTFSTSVPLGVADEELFDTLAMRDPSRITFMVLDCRGVVRFAAPVAPDAEDLDAAIDEILAAAEQAEHQRTSRR